jgi:cell division protease FtsH
VAKNLLESNLQKLHMMADALIRYETIDSGQIDQIMEGHEPDPPEGWQDGNGDSAESTEEKAEGADRTSVGGPAEQL